MSETWRLMFADTTYDVCITLVRQHADDGDVALALDQARQAIGVNPSRPEAFNLLGVCYEFRRLPLEAQKFYRTALALDPAYGPAQRNLHRLVCFHKRGRIDLGET